MALLISLFLMPVLIKISHHKQWLDDPNHRKVHTEPVSRLGGIGMFLALVITGSLSPLISSFLTEGRFIVWSMVMPNIPFIAATGMVFLVGVLDDFVNLRSSIKLVCQILAALVVCWGGGLIGGVQIPFFWVELNLGWADWPLTVLWIIGITNAINLIDGIDGLAATVSLIAFIAYGIVFLITGHMILALVCFILAGSIVGYLYFNFPPAKLFMGDSGSLFLGFVLAILPLMPSCQSSISLFMPITILSFAIFDVFSSIIRRTRKRIMFSNPDMEHTHHKLLKLGLNNREILAAVTGLMVLNSIPIVLSQIGSFKIAAPYMVGMWFLTALLFFILHVIYHKNLEAAEHFKQN